LLGLSVVRTLPHGSLEGGFDYAMRNFDTGTLLNDENSWNGDLAWFFKPGFAPKTSLGVGLGFGEDKFARNSDRVFYSPSLRMRYRLSAKTQLHSSVGYEFRNAEAIGSIDNDTPVFETGLSWQPSNRTGFDFRFYKEVRGSYSNVGEEVGTTGVSLKLNQELPGEFRLGSSVGFENADYVSTIAGPAATRDDNFFRLSLDLSHPLRLTDKLGGDWSLFYSCNNNDSNLAQASFDQSIVGMRVGLAY